jgi:DNA replication protein DnaC
MNQIRETIRLDQEAGLGNRQIARALGISRPSVAQYLTDYRSSGLSYSAIASHIPIPRWHQIIGEPTIADAICDRIIHHAHRIELEGESVRKKYAER